MLIKHAGSYREIYDAFRWNVPQRFNIATACCDRWAADPDRVASDPRTTRRAGAPLHLRRVARAVQPMRQYACRAWPSAQRDRVLLLLGQRPETAILHLRRLARRHDQRALLHAVRRRCGLLPGTDIRREGRHHGRHQPGQGDQVAGDAQVLCVDSGRGEPPTSEHCCVRLRAPSPPVDTAADDPALLLFTSSTAKDRPKGALRPPLAARAHAVHRDAATSSHSPAMWCGRRPTGPGSPG